ncbi:2-succinyl-5-enolpyruvyl-6-hydroxy-3-cyclohexene-1-carboxylic-acid synthase [Alkalibacillus aidingensis]|uniref:2-succinyl-5-enolpyruvyl-6-hydroxy-3- cyclohexene-1-carboxylic-acid synthase n=1 Tax=Alkalibacillus aidingensis TaxID=2747607 RepID=UPI0016603C94|nr:2-succinyl-5-enolpyruvyl-6-hydroxy-3-cyclohexene-1-carboxylic-acid synthase [Alkalibacillus aidingensis]
MTMEAKTYYVSYFVDELYQKGMEDIVISPGSRSTPLAMLVAEHPHLNDWLHFDERSAAFFALGIAKAKQKPVALVCTSGTAAANYYPAIVEAYYSRVPLVVLTADRPHELRDNGAPQAIDQIKMYGEYTKQFYEMALPESSDMMLAYARRQASRAYEIANKPNQGVVQVNFPFRDPLIPDLNLTDLWGKSETPHIQSVSGFELVTPDQLEEVFSILKGKERGLIVCGELTTQEESDAVLALAKAWKVPLLTDVLSHGRQSYDTNPYVISTYDALLKNQAFANSYKPDFIIRFGSMPVSKPYLQWLTNNPPELHIVVDQQTGYREPTGMETTFIYSDTASLIKEMLKKEPPVINQAWTEEWLTLDHGIKELLTNYSSEELTEGSTVSVISRNLPGEQTIFVGNSMPIRDMDTFFLPCNKAVRIRANRGVNGIDGIISSAFGVAASGEEVTLLIGDLSFLHDYTALLIGQKNGLSIRIIVINNNGGGIFSFLPQHEYGKHFEYLFGTPYDPPIKEMVEALGYHYQQVTTQNELKEIAKKPVDGLEIIEVQTNRDDNLAWHRAMRAKVNSYLEHRLREDQ